MRIKIIDETSNTAFQRAINEELCKIEKGCDYPEIEYKIFTIGQYHSSVRYIAILTYR